MVCIYAPRPAPPRQQAQKTAHSLALGHTTHSASENEGPGCPQKNPESTACRGPLLLTSCWEKERKEFGGRNEKEIRNERKTTEGRGKERDLVQV